MKTTITADELAQKAYDLEKRRFHIQQLAEAERGLVYAGLNQGVAESAMIFDLAEEELKEIASAFRHIGYASRTFGIEEAIDRTYADIVAKDGDPYL